MDRDRDGTVIHSREYDKENTPRAGAYAHTPVQYELYENYKSDNVDNGSVGHDIDDIESSTVRSWHTDRVQPFSDETGTSESLNNNYGSEKYRARDSAGDIHTDLNSTLKYPLKSRHSVDMNSEVQVLRGASRKHFTQSCTSDFMKSKIGWVELVGPHNSCTVFARAHATDLTGKFELFTDENMTSTVNSFILGHPRTSVAVVDDTFCIETLTGACLCKCHSVDEVKEWTKVICYPVFSALPVTKSEEYSTVERTDTVEKPRRRYVDNQPPGAQHRSTFYMAKNQANLRILSRQIKAKKEKEEATKRKVEMERLRKKQEVLERRNQRLKEKGIDIESYNYRSKTMLGDLNSMSRVSMKPTVPISPSQRELENSRARREKERLRKKVLEREIAEREEAILQERLDEKKRRQQAALLSRHQSSQSLLSHIKSVVRDNSPGVALRRTSACMSIQRVWRGVLARKTVQSLRLQMSLKLNGSAMNGTQRRLQLDVVNGTRKHTNDTYIPVSTHIVSNERTDIAPVTPRRKIVDQLLYCNVPNQNLSTSSRDLERVNVHDKNCLRVDGEHGPADTFDPIREVLYKREDVKEIVPREQPQLNSHMTSDASFFSDLTDLDFDTKLDLISNPPCFTGASADVDDAVSPHAHEPHSPNLDCIRELSANSDFVNSFSRDSVPRTSDDKEDCGSPAIRIDDSEHRSNEDIEPSSFERDDADEQGVAYAKGVSSDIAVDEHVVEEALNTNAPGLNIDNDPHSAVQSMENNSHQSEDRPSDEKSPGNSVDSTFDTTPPADIKATDTSTVMGNETSAVTKTPRHRRAAVASVESIASNHKVSHTEALDRLGAGKAHMIEVHAGGKLIGLVSSREEMIEMVNEYKRKRKLEKRLRRTQTKLKTVNAFKGRQHDDGSDKSSLQSGADCDADSELKSTTNLSISAMAKEQKRSLDAHMNEVRESESAVLEQAAAESTVKQKGAQEDAAAQRTAICREVLEAKRNLAMGDAVAAVSSRPPVHTQANHVEITPVPPVNPRNKSILGLLGFSSRKLTQT